MGVVVRFGGLYVPDARGLCPMRTPSASTLGRVNILFNRHNNELQFMRIEHMNSDEESELTTTGTATPYALCCRRLQRCQDSTLETTGAFSFFMFFYFFVIQTSYQETSGAEMGGYTRCSEFLCRVLLLDTTQLPFKDNSIHWHISGPT